MFRFLVAGLLLFSVNVGFSAESPTEGADPIKKCVEECFAFYQTPGPELKRCITDCAKKLVEACETYEEDCDRGENGPRY